MKCDTYNEISNLYDASNFSKAPPYTSIFDSIDRDIGKYLIIEIGIFPYYKEAYSSEMWYIQWNQQ
ncbi:hypothetical protein, partial [Bacillus paramycoides]|uniref:hypothetical protein n=1 Tax=Bacillus paramycoides TaxID=2026194 RepID=UPI002E1B157C|nr:hypothetical protein [Bacillus paramycoides]